MSSSYKNDDIFGSGPHQFNVGRRGRRIVPLSAIANDASVAGAEQFGEFELRVEVRGRLVATTESNLRNQIDDILAYTDSGETSGTLRDGNGAEWDGVKLLNLELFGAIERGRAFSVSYTAEFGELAGG